MKPNLLNFDGKASGDAGFTRADLTATAAVLAVLSLIGASSMASLNGSDSRAVCLQNLKQMTLAWTAYAHDNGGSLVPAHDWTGGGSTPEWTGGQWLDLPVNDVSELDPYAGVDGVGRGIATSRLWPYTGDNPVIWRCPEDQSSGSHPDYMGGQEAPRVRSYAMNNWMGGFGWAASGSNWKVLKRFDDIRAPRPSEAFVLIGERPGSINDGYLIVDMRGFRLGTAENSDARIVDYPATYHSGGASVSYADGHVAVKVWQDPRTTPADPYSKIPLNVASPDNPDVHWLQYRATRLTEQAHALQFGAAEISGDGVRLPTTTRDGYAYEVEASSDLVSWEKIGEANPGEDSEVVVDSDVNASGQRFYRARRHE